MIIIRIFLLLLVVVLSNLGAGQIVKDGASVYQLFTLYLLPLFVIGAYVFVDKIYSKKAMERALGYVFSIIFIGLILINFAIILFPINKCSIESLNGKVGYEDCDTSLRSTYVFTAVVALTISTIMSYKTQHHDKELLYSKNSITNKKL